MTSSQILAKISIFSEKYSDVFSFPSFGAERRGAPVEAYCRISGQKIWKRSQVEKAHIGMVLDASTLGASTSARFHNNAKILINTPTDEATLKTIRERFFSEISSVEFVAADLVSIAREIHLISRENHPIINTSILGLLAHADLGLTLEDIRAGLENHFGKSPRTDLNFEAARLAHERSHRMEFA